MKIVGLRILLVLSLLIGFGTASSVGAEAQAANVKIEQWTGHSFTLLPLHDDTQAAGYEIFSEEQATQGFAGDRSVRLPYAAYVGKEVTVTDVVPVDVIDSQQEYMVHMTVNDTGEKLLARSMRGQVDGLVLTDDLKNARQQFLGKTVYPKFRVLSATTTQAVTTKIGSPVTVVDVYAGHQSQAPIYLVVAVNGEKAIVPIAYSWTNISRKSWTQTPPWNNALFMVDPRISLGGSQDLWSEIEAGTIEKGMTKGQVQLSWGKPVSVERHNSVWNYGTQQLSFNGDKLHSIKALPKSK